MNQFEKEYQYVLSQSRVIYTAADLESWKQLRRQFTDKYIVLLSQTDKKFIQIRQELLEIEQKKTKEISSGYLFK